jgi:RNA polymerase sigma factor (sigma-70 family)
MSCRDPRDRGVSDAAAIEFHRRHITALHARCARLCRQMGLSDSAAEDLVAVTMAKAIEKAHTFADDTSSAPSTSRTRSWLGTIARNLLADSLRNPHRPGPLTGAQEEIPLEDYSTLEIAALYCDGKQLDRDNETIRLVQQAMCALDERTRAVLSHTVLQRQRSPKGSYMYRGSAEALAARFETTTVNLRRIRRNGVRAIADYVKLHRKT